MLAFKIIVVPTDFSDHSLRALPYAVSLAEKFNARLKVIFVSEPALQVADVAWVGIDERSMSQEHLEEARRNLERIALEQVPTDVQVDAEVLTGDAVEAVISYARDVNADLVVMATHGRGGLSHMLMGSVAEQIVRKAPCPVLTLKQPMAVSAGDDSD
ncbi:MAG: universal stress protein [Candidatus Krumholzibacteria bacterium]|nr:universal stress protein [Candidatus Krumholzibacteria bacterium]